MDPDQDRHSAGPDLGPNSFRRLLAGEQKLPLERKEFGSRSGQTFCSSVGPDLGPSSWQRLTAEDKSCRWKEMSLDPDQDRRSAALSVLIWVHTSCKGYQQRTKIAAGKVRDCIQIMTDILWVLIWVQTVCKGYPQEDKICQWKGKFLFV